MSNEVITIKGKDVHAVSPEGQTATISVHDLVTKLSHQRMDTNGVVLPDGIKSVASRGPVTIWVHQTPPRVWQFKWISTDSPKHYGPGAKYRMIKIALPYLVVFAVYAPGETGQVMLSQFNECFFRTHPLDDVEKDELLYPALLNCSKFHVAEGNPLSWICTQHLDRRQFFAEPNTSKRMRLGLKALLSCLLDTGFNYSSEHHEQSSWFSESVGVDPRVSTVENWQAATEKDPLFVLDVKWLQTGLTVQQMCERIFRIRGANRPTAMSAADVARIVFNNQAT
jgi:hypothetical protein